MSEKISITLCFSSKGLSNDAAEMESRVILGSIKAHRVMTRSAMKLLAEDDKIVCGLAGFLKSDVASQVLSNPYSVSMLKSWLGYDFIVNVNQDIPTLIYQYNDNKFFKLIGLERADKDYIASEWQKAISASIMHSFKFFRLNILNMDIEFPNNTKVTWKPGLKA